MLENFLIISFSCLTNHYWALSGTFFWLLNWNRTVIYLRRGKLCTFDHIKRFSMWVRVVPTLKTYKIRLIVCFLNSFKRIINNFSIFTLRSHLVYVLTRMNDKQTQKKRQLIHLHAHCCTIKDTIPLWFTKLMTSGKEKSCLYIVADISKSIYTTHTRTPD